MPAPGPTARRAVLLLSIAATLVFAAALGRPSLVFLAVFLLVFGVAGEAFTMQTVFYPLMIATIGMGASILGSFFVKPGKGTAFTRTKMKSLTTGNTLERTFRTGEKLTPEARRRLAKPEAGSIRLSIHRDGSEVVFELADDGRGLDLPAIRRQAQVLAARLPGVRVEYVHSGATAFGQQS